MRPSSIVRVLILVAAFFRSSSSGSAPDERSDYSRESVKLLYGETHGISWTDLGDDQRKPPILTTPNMKIYSVDYQYKRNLFFFTGDGAIWRKRWADGELEYEIVDRRVGATTLSVDWVNDRIYWTDPANSSVWRCDLEGERRDLLLTDVGKLTEHSNVAVDPYMMYVFLATESGYTLRMDLGGDSSVKLNHSLKRTSIALDNHNRRVYITGLKGFTSEIQSFDYDGGNILNLRGGKMSWVWLGSIAVFSGMEGEPIQLFWVHHDWGALDTVWKVNVTEDQLSWEKEYQAKRDLAPTIWCVKVYHPDVQARPRCWEAEHREWPKETHTDRHGTASTSNVTVSNDSKTSATFIYIILPLAFSFIF